MTINVSSQAKLLNMMFPYNYYREKEMDDHRDSADGPTDPYCELGG